MGESSDLAALEEGRRGKFRSRTCGSKEQEFFWLERVGEMT